MKPTYYIVLEAFHLRLYDAYSLLFSSYTLYLLYSGLRESEELIQSGLDIPRFSVSPKLRRPRLSSISSVAETTSPIVARRATVIQEWNRLQRTHSLSSRSVGGRERGEEKVQTNRIDKVIPVPCGLAVIE